ncbi:hypothetical protein Mro03_07270 [Microbispora rosea subsp. rosea]|nr:hypothetical protein Mro03_07270 [Microbispora rosea subsp. rosea]
MQEALDPLHVELQYEDPENDPGEPGAGRRRCQVMEKRLGREGSETFLHSLDQISGGGIDVALRELEQ